MTPDMIVRLFSSLIKDSGEWYDSFGEKALYIEPQLGIDSYIDSGYKPNNETGFLIDYNIADNYISVDNVICGCNSSSGDRFYIGQDDTPSCGWLDTNYKNITFNTPGINQYKLNYFNNRIYSINNNDVVSDLPENVDFNSPLNKLGITLFAYGTNNASNPSFYSYGRLYSFKITQGSNIVRDYIPIRITKETTDKLGNVIPVGAYVLGDNITKTIPYHSTTFSGSMLPVPEPTLDANYITHRGKSLIAGMVELAGVSFRTSGDLGYYGAETDIRETSDGKFICMHNSTINATTTGTGYVSDLTLDQILTYNLITSSYESSDYKLKPLTFEQYMEICVEYNMHPVIEIKELLSYDRTTALMDIAQSYVGNNYTIIAFDMQYLQTARAYNANIGLQYLKSSNPTSLEITQMQDINADFSCTYTLIDIDLINQIHEAGIKIAAWTVNKQSVGDSLDLLGVDYISTDILVDPINSKDSITSIELQAENLEIGQWNGNISSISFEDPGMWISKTNRIHGQPFKILGTTQFYRVNKNDATYKAAVLFFDIDKQMLSDMGWLTQGTLENVPPLAYYAMIYVTRNDNASFSAAEKLKIENIVFQFNRVIS